jgi:hypothetical protein
MGSLHRTVSDHQLAFLSSPPGRKPQAIGPGGEDPKNEPTPRFRRHGPLIENRQVPQDLALAVQKRHGHVTVDAALDQRGCPGEMFRNPRRVMHQPAADDLGTRGPGEVILEVGADPVALPEREGADVRRGLGEFGDDGVVNVDGFRYIADQGPKEFLPGASGSPFDHRLEGAKVVAHGEDGRRLARAGQCLARSLDQGRSGVRLMDPVAPPGPSATIRNLLGPMEGATWGLFQARSANKLALDYTTPFPGRNVMRTVSNTATLREAG